MRSRTVREGSVGLLILAGLLLFGGLILWIRGLNPGSRSYRFTVLFESVAGMQAGAPVRYRGVRVGKIVSVQPSANAAEVIVEIDSSELLIPHNVTVEANQIGLIGETSIDIIPVAPLPTSALANNPLSDDCNNSVVVCEGALLEGQVGVSYDTLIRATVNISNLFTETGFFEEIRELTRNSADAAAGVANLTDEFANLTQTLDVEIASLTNSAIATTDAVGLAVTEIGLTANQVNELLEVNRGALIGTLDNISLASQELQSAIAQLSPMLDQGDLLANLETLSNNAAIASDNAVIASANLRDLTEAFGNDENLLLLQQTLDSARATFQNAQKITADLDELTGDPEFRQDIRDLVDGLSGLVSSVQDLQQQTQIAQLLDNPAIATQPQHPVEAQVNPQPNSQPNSQPSSQPNSATPTPPDLFASPSPSSAPTTTPEPTAEAESSSENGAAIAPAQSPYVPENLSILDNNENIRLQPLIESPSSAFSDSQLDIVD